MIKQLSKQHKITILCKILKCSTSAYYGWQKGKNRKRELHRRRLTTLVRTTYHGSDRTYGSPRIYKEIKELAVPCSRTHIVKIMQQQQLWAVQKRKFKVTIDSGHDLPVAENILNRDFTADSPNKKWVSDISYIRTKEGWLYLGQL
ncbi:IS3 family transposase [Chitinophaga sancti]|uniref:IS3 family transposase n=1 Tax=Chitinophaga sancti TaxID=1004 RepID=UPI002A7616AF|nr:IS3 family transposase [Chitinophaga sancti]WPQ63359.1 IS3 family transposase [Chitinophaga sancti]